MLDLFIKKVNELYDIILQPIDIMYKNTAINNMKKEFNIEYNEHLGTYYNKISNNKNKGVIYTPYRLAEYIVKSTIRKDDIINNPYIKICDPACGSGNILILCYKHLFDIYTNNLKEINEKNSINIQAKDIPYHIINENIYACDINEASVKILIIDLFALSFYYNTKNICKKDFLTESKFNANIDIFVGNPPYIGHKLVNKEYSIKLKDTYKDVYIDKGDISYCFFSRALSLMNNGGKLTFITSRYFIESPSGIGIRNMLGNYYIYRIVDFYGIRPFKGVGIDIVIIFLSKSSQLKENANVEIIKPNHAYDKCKDNFFCDIYINDIKKENKFYIKKEQLKKDRWNLIKEEQLAIVEKIEQKCNFYLGDVCDSFQGIITGCDKAFIVDDSIIDKYHLEKEIIKPWIKSSDIKKDFVQKGDKYIIYSNLIEDEKKYTQSIQYIGQYKDKLMGRRECVRGTRKWFELQWGRDVDLFENKKIVFPYKSNCNRFAIDSGNYYSADIYSLVLKDKHNFTYDFLLFILNSKIYEFYFKTFAKKLGDDIYEYYPNTLLKLKVPSINNIDEFSEKSILDFFELNQLEKNIINKCI